jgi:hypothetical protein
MLARKRNVYRYYSPITQQPWYYTRQGRLEIVLCAAVLAAMAAAIYWLA